MAEEQKQDDVVLDIHDSYLTVSDPNKDRPTEFLRALDDALKRAKELAGQIVKEDEDGKNRIRPGS